jgi:hypothetical protein
MMTRKLPLLIGLIITLMGCQPCPQMIKPSKPTFKVNKLPDGGISLDKQNATELGKYIIELERGYK